MEKNHKDFDYQIVTIKKDKSKELIKNYESFGWSMISEKQHNMYENLLEVEFLRPHKLKNKDDLQFLQVNLENLINKTSSLEQSKHVKSLTLGIITGFCVAILILFAVFSPLKLEHPLGLVMCLFYSIAASAILLISTSFTAKIINKEKQDFEKEYQNNMKEMKSISKKAKSLLEDNHE